MSQYLLPCTAPSTTRCRRRRRCSRCSRQAPAGCHGPRTHLRAPVFNEGYLASSGEAPTRDELTAEAIRLGRVLRELMPQTPEVAGLLALMLLTEARVRRAWPAASWSRCMSRTGAAGTALIAEGHDLVRECLAVNRPGQYQLLAAVNAVHTDAPTAGDTTPGTPPGPTCCVGWGAAPTRERLTTPPSPRPRTTPSALTCRGGEGVSRRNLRGVTTSPPPLQLPAAGAPRRHEARVPTTARNATSNRRE